MANDRLETKLSIRTPEEIQEVLMNPAVPISEECYPAVGGTSLRAAYYMVRRPGMNITILPEYRLGQEYPKTYGHFHKPEAEETYEILLGEAAMLVQKGVDPVTEVRLVRLRKGDSITVPKGYAHSLINLGRGPVVTVDDYDPANFENVYDQIRAKRGFAYYLIEESGKLRAVANPSYGDVPPLEME